MLVTFYTKQKLGYYNHSIQTCKTGLAAYSYLYEFTKLNKPGSNRAETAFTIIYFTQVPKFFILITSIILAV